MQVGIFAKPITVNLDLVVFNELRFAKELSGLGLILRLDLSPTMIGKGHDSTVVYGIEEALQLGADAVIVNAGPGVGVEEKTLPALALAAAECDRWGMPLIGEMSPGGFDSDPAIRTLENIKLGARIACELGVDMIKTIYHPGYQEVVEASFVPIVVLGGAKTPDEVKYLESIKQAIDEGASGVAIGRNIWGHDNPRGMTRALWTIIHGNGSLMVDLSGLINEQVPFEKIEEGFKRAMSPKTYRVVVNI